MELICPLIVGPVSAVAREVLVVGCVPGTIVRIVFGKQVVGVQEASNETTEVKLTGQLTVGLSLGVIANHPKYGSVASLTQLRVIAGSFAGLIGPPVQVAAIPPHSRCVGFVAALPGAIVRVYASEKLVVGEATAHGGKATMTLETPVANLATVVQGSYTNAGDWLELSLPVPSVFSGSAVSPGGLSAPVAHFQTGAATLAVSQVVPGSQVFVKLVDVPVQKLWQPKSFAIWGQPKATVSAAGEDTVNVQVPPQSSTAVPKKYQIQPKPKKQYVVWQSNNGVKSLGQSVAIPKPVQPRSPRVWSRLRPERTTVVVDHLIHGALLAITVQRGSLEFTGVSGAYNWGHAEFSLPSSITTLQIGDRLTLRQRLGSLWSEPSPPVTVWQSAPQSNRLRFVAAPMEGAIGVAVSAHPGAVLAVRSEKFGGIIGRKVVERVQDFVDISPALAANDILTLVEVLVQQVLPMAKSDIEAIVATATPSPAPTLVDIGIWGLHLVAAAGSVVDLMLNGQPVGSRTAKESPFCRISSPRLIASDDKLSCAARTGAVLGKAAQFVANDEKERRGFWYDIGGPEAAEILGLHAAILPTGKILLLGGHENSQEKWDSNQLTEVRLFDDQTHELTRINGPQYSATSDNVYFKHNDKIDLFCCGHAILANGKLLFAGGTEQPPGLYSDLSTHGAFGHQPGSHESWLFDPNTEVFTPTDPLSAFITTDGKIKKSEFVLEPSQIALDCKNDCVSNLKLPSSGVYTDEQNAKLSACESDCAGFAWNYVGGRWYPTVLELPNGKALALGGHPGSKDLRHNNWTVEEFSPASTIEKAGTWDSIAGSSIFAGPPKWMNPLGYATLAIDISTSGFMYPRTFIGGQGLPSKPWIYTFYWLNKHVVRFQPLPNGPAQIGETAPGNTSLDMWPATAKVTANASLTTRHKSNYAIDAAAPDLKSVELVSGLDFWFGTDHTAATMLPLDGTKAIGDLTEPGRILFCGSILAVLYDLGVGQFYRTARPEMIGPRASPPNRFRANGTWLPSGELVVSGGIDGAVAKNTEGKLSVQFSEIVGSSKDAQGTEVPLWGPLGGGIQDIDGIHSVEVFEPPAIGQALDQANPDKNGKWRVGAAARESRNYHGVALLLPDGSVFVGSSNRDAASTADSANLSIEIYQPWYFWRERPVIQAVVSGLTVKPNVQIKLKCTAILSVKQLSHAVLIRCYSVTHAFSSDSRFVTLPILDGVINPDESVTVAIQAFSSPTVVIPGPYMIFVVTKENVPSKAVFVNVEGA